MSKFLKLLSENAPDKSQHHQLLKELGELLQHLGFNCKEDDENGTDGIHISVAHEEDAEMETSAATALLPQKDKVALSAQAQSLVPVFRSAIDKVKRQLTSPSTTI